MKDNVLSVHNIFVSFKQRKSFFRHKIHHVLEDISFDVKKGENLGIIGENGCGKSTLLKLLSGIIEPDAGQINAYSNKLSLLTLSAGFDKELSGRDNAIISSMLLGHTKKLALESLESINEFAELGDLFYQPVKTYSAGMRARLGFATAIKMQSDVLLIDEVLGVGDASFKQKANKEILDKFNSEQSVILVSHSANQIKNLCDRAIWLEKGRVKMSGRSDEVTSAYMQAAQQKSQSEQT